MKSTKLLMGMPVTIEIVDQAVTHKDIDEIFDYFKYIDEKFSTYKDSSEISRINKGLLNKNQWSKDMRAVFRLSEQTKEETNGYFDILRNGKYDPSGMVKGWAIQKAAEILKQRGFKNFYIDAGGDIQVYGKNKESKLWRVGIKNPFDQKQIVKVLEINNKGVATSGTYIRGQHVYNPHDNKQEITEIVSLTVIGSNIYEADRFATAAFAMGKKGIEFIESKKGFEGYMINKDGVATMTGGFEKYIAN